jgi:hypothetical protein
MGQRTGEPGTGNGTEPGREGRERNREGWGRELVNREPGTGNGTEPGREGRERNREGWGRELVNREPGTGKGREGKGTEPGRMK